MLLVTLTSLYDSYLLEVLHSRKSSPNGSRPLVIFWLLVYDLQVFYGLVSDHSTSQLLLPCHFYL